MKISIIISTYNAPKNLCLVLQALAKQTTKNFEVVIADDGSTAETQQLIEFMRPQLPYKIKHVWQEDIGFRLAKIRNKAIVAASGDFIIFIDVDCLPLPTFVQKYIKLAEPGYFIAGNRVLLAPNFIPQSYDFLQLFFAYCQKKINRLLPFVYLQLGFLRKINKTKWRAAKGCNLGIWKKDLLEVNGFDESFTGWGYEDSDLVIRLIRNKIFHKSGRFAVPVMHIWHPENSRENANSNLQKLQQTMMSQATAAQIGIYQYLN